MEAYSPVAHVEALKIVLGTDHMNFWDEKRSLQGVRTCDEEKIPCRFCRFATKGYLDDGGCKKYDIKPHDVYFENAPCPEFEEGEDLLPYQIQI